MINQMRKESFERAKKVKLIIMDVDGTLTDGGIYIGENGELFKAFHCRDGFGIKLAQRVGLKIAIITGRKSKPVEVRAGELNIEPNAIWQGNLDKREAYIQLKERFQVTDEEIAYIGDDILDLPIMVQVGFTGAVANAVTEVKNRSCVVSDYNGGEGAVREVIEFILKAKGIWQEIVNEYIDPEIKQPKEPFYLAANKSNQAAPLRQPLQQSQPTQPAQQMRVPPTATARPNIPAQSTPQATRPAMPTRPPQPQQSKDENLEKLDKIGQKLNTRF